ncbi:MAG: DegT/DnrJ/EryC1/StrS family aminotransferase [Planctomycetaceae bacterium]|nr:DegT/DnrJ/EryC1/StrS family aminotransferase [Planctomycetaceae bacterium]
MPERFSRRDFLATSSQAGLAAVLAGTVPTVLVGSGASPDGKPALLGGTAMAKLSYSGWPILYGDEEKEILGVLRSGHWFRSHEGSMVPKFEDEYAEMCGAKACIATNSGTSALVSALAAIDIGPGDEVITTPYTFIATINAVIGHFALPVLVDVDIDTFQIDGKLADAACTENTRCLLPVHIGGYPANMDDFVEIGKKRNIRVIEDACQGHFGEWRGKKFGTLGDAGCFSFQVSKNIPGGEGGAVLTNDEILADRIYRSHYNCIGRKSGPNDYTHGLVRGLNHRMTEFQGALLRVQMKHARQFVPIREENGRYLNKLLAEIPGVVPAKLDDRVTTNAWHLYMFRIDPEKFGIDRNLFLRALRAENIGGSGGYGHGDWIEFVRRSYDTPAGKRVYPKPVLDQWVERVSHLPQFEKVYSQTVWFSQNMLIGPKENMEIIADAVRRIQNNAAEIAKA